MSVTHGRASTPRAGWQPGAGLREHAECAGGHAEHEVPDGMAGGCVQDGLNF